MTMSKSKAKKISAKQSTTAQEQGQPVDVAKGTDAPADRVVTTPAADPAPAEAAALAVAEAEAPEPAKEPKAPRVPRDQRNGITRPAEGKCRAVWNVLDGLSSEGREITFKELRGLVGSEVADATVRTQ
jgi:hypothetical protein